LGPSCLAQRDPILPGNRAALPDGTVDADHAGRLWFKIASTASDIALPVSTVTDNQFALSKRLLAMASIDGSPSRVASARYGLPVEDFGASASTGRVASVLIGLAFAISF
jgi:hypothetical protein